MDIMHRRHNPPKGRYVVDIMHRPHNPPKGRYVVDIIHRRHNPPKGGLNVNNLRCNRRQTDKKTINPEGVE
ncbi:MAG: hypothetical protein IH593_14260 [Bacteroidales bacterium]|nr:hypothetical protein [Bacteroidales bacterium]